MKYVSFCGVTPPNIVHMNESSSDIIEPDVEDVCLVFEQTPQQYLLAAEWIISNWSVLAKGTEIGNMHPVHGSNDEDDVDDNVDDDKSEHVREGSQERIRLWRVRLDERDLGDYLMELDKWYEIHRNQHEPTTQQQQQHCTTTSAAAAEKEEEGEEEIGSSIQRKRAKMFRDQSCREEDGQETDVSEKDHESDVAHVPPRPYRGWFHMFDAFYPFTLERVLIDNMHTHVFVESALARADDASSSRGKPQERTPPPDVCSAITHAIGRIEGKWPIKRRSSTSVTFTELCTWGVRGLRHWTIPDLLSGLTRLQTELLWKLYAREYEPGFANFGEDTAGAGAQANRLVEVCIGQADAQRRQRHQQQPLQLRHRDADNEDLVGSTIRRVPATIESVHAMRTQDLVQYAERISGVLREEIRFQLSALVWQDLIEVCGDYVKLGKAENEGGETNGFMPGDKAPSFTPAFNLGSDSQLCPTIAKLAGTVWKHLASIAPYVDWAHRAHVVYSTGFLSSSICDPAAPRPFSRNLTTYIRRRIAMGDGHRKANAHVDIPVSESALELSIPQMVHWRAIPVSSMDDWRGGGRGRRIRTRARHRLIPPPTVSVQNIKRIATSHGWTRVWSGWEDGALDNEQLCNGRGSFAATAAAAAPSKKSSTDNHFGNNKSNAHVPKSIPRERLAYEMFPEHCTRIWMDHTHQYGVPPPPSIHATYPIAKRIHYKQWQHAKRQYGAWLSREQIIRGWPARCLLGDIYMQKRITHSVYRDSSMRYFVDDPLLHKKLRLESRFPGVDSLALLGLPIAYLDCDWLARGVAPDAEVAQECRAEMDHVVFGGENRTIDSESSDAIYRAAFEDTPTPHEEIQVDERWAEQLKEDGGR